MTMNLELQALRVQVDAVDAQIVDLLASRFRITAQIGQLKAAHALNAVDPEREAAQEARFRALAQAHGLKPELVVRVFRSIIDEVVSNHREV
jgi:chorismate mutase